MNSQPPYVGRTASPKLELTPQQRELIGIWEDIDNRGEQGWGTGGLSRQPRVGGSDILKAEAILRAQERMKDSYQPQPTNPDF